MSNPAPLALPDREREAEWGEDTAVVEWSGQRPMIVHLEGGGFDVVWEQEDVLNAPGVRSAPAQDVFVAKWTK